MADKGIDFRLEFGQRMTAFAAAFVLAIAAVVLYCCGLVSEGIVLGAFGMITTIAGLLQVFRSKEKEMRHTAEASMHKDDAQAGVQRVEAVAEGRSIGFGGE